ncbi:MAG: aldo/keto reductase [bacterium]|nr:aldo/keto reductase [bacterium]
MAQHKQESHKINRRKFFKFGGAAIAGATINFPSIGNILPQQTETETEKIKAYRVLGRTGFKVSDIGMGTNRSIESNIIRYAYDKGVNYFDSAEGYGNGRSERMIGEALKFMDRKKVFITTKIHINDNETKESIIDRCYKCLERLQTEYVDAFFMHGPLWVSSLNHQAYHEAIAQLKSDGKLKHSGVSCHGPRGNEGDSMEKVLCAAAEDGRFDLMLLTYSFMNHEPGDKILAACKKNNVGTTAMKTAPGIFNVEPVDPENLSEDQQEYVKRMMERGSSREEAIEGNQNECSIAKNQHSLGIPEPGYAHDMRFVCRF